MSIMKRFINWVLGADKNPATAEPDHHEIIQAEIVMNEPVVEKKSHPEQTSKQPSPEEFLKDLKNIEIKKSQFEGAREEMLRELKKMAPNSKIQYK